MASGEQLLTEGVTPFRYTLCRHGRKLFNLPLIREIFTHDKHPNELTNTR